ncbi:Nucleoporin NUP56 [Erysiphe neolycopersici]|uniref:Nucleoporin NUP56 n=1 Tax=Erysiphe neolycopersici TaxID=212602 RepID=A0A420HHN6_9PEZI|nr:Nucleoporin NUP56 [Erysiphe neolycopersici]
MCVSNDVQTKEERIITSQIIEKESDVSDSLLTTNKKPQHDQVTGDHADKIRIELFMASQLQNEESKLLNSSKDKLPPQPTSLVTKDHEMVHRLSPKKKRSRDQIEESKEPENQDVDKLEIKQESHVNPIRASSSEPEKKRLRDASESTKSPEDQKEVVNTMLQAPKNIEEVENMHKNKIIDDKPEIIPNPAPAEHLEKPKLAFANSGFASLAASSVSPFGSLGLTKSSVFGGGFNKICGSDTSKLSSNIILSNTNNTSNNFPNKGTSTPISFSNKIEPSVKSVASESVFTSVSSNGGFFSNAGPKLSSFATPGTGFQTLKTKETRAFGAPEISNEDDSEAYNSDGNNHGENNDNRLNVIGNEEKLKSKIKIDDGEADEVTLLQIRAKLFAVESKAAGWKERGVGTLKINVAKQFVKYDQNGIPISGTFNKPNKKCKDKCKINIACAARLIMRQENTHRVVLNTFILREMEFEEKPAVSSAQFLFTALEGEKELKPVRLLLKMSEINAKLFRAEIDSIKSKL